MRTIVRFVTALTLSLLVAPGVALAQPDFPDSLQKATGAPCVPQCSVCHDSVNGGGPIDQPFGKSLGDYGGYQGRDAIKAGVEGMKQDNVDSDGDGVGDVDELERGTDPNYAGDARLCLPDAGCGAHVAPQPPDDGIDIALAIAVILGMGLSRQRRERCKDPEEEE